jgi:hypothetical protein
MKVLEAAFQMAIDGAHQHVTIFWLKAKCGLRDHVDIHLDGSLDIEQHNASREEELAIIRNMTPEERQMVREVRNRARERIKAGGRDKLIPPPAIEVTATPVKDG